MSCGILNPGLSVHLYVSTLLCYLEIVIIFSNTLIINFVSYYMVFILVLFSSLLVGINYYSFFQMLNMVRYMYIGKHAVLTLFCFS